MRRRLLAMLCLTLAAAALVSCKGPSYAVRETGVSSSSRLRISGSGTCIPLLEILTRRYPDKSVEFAYLPGLHSGGGIKGVAQKDLEIGSVSRDLTQEEKALGLKYYLLSDDGLVMAVHPSVGLEGLTTKQVRDIYAGKYNNWKQLGAGDLPIVVLDRNEDESAKIILRKYVLGQKLQITDKAVNMFYESDMVEGLRTMPGAIGYFSLGYGISRHIEVGYLALDGVKATVDNIMNGKYKMVRPLGIVVSSKADPAVGQDVAAFSTWVVGPEAKKIMRDNGFAPAK